MEYSTNNYIEICIKANNTKLLMLIISKYINQKDFDIINRLNDTFITISYTKNKEYTLEFINEDAIGDDDIVAYNTIFEHDIMKELITRTLFFGTSFNIYIMDQLDYNFLQYAIPLNFNIPSNRHGMLQVLNRK